MAPAVGEYELNVPVPFRLHVEDELLSMTKEKLRLARFPQSLTDIADDDWSTGSPVKEVQRLAQYWHTGFDWRRQEAAINTDFTQYKVKIDVIEYGPQIIHFAHQRSAAANAIPLLFVAGWPGSFLEARKLIKPLTNPGNAQTQAFHLIVASIPGFGPGDAPTKTGLGPLRTANAFKTLMVEVLGYDRFVTQGGDFGSWITLNMAHLYPQHLRACHTNFFMCGPPPFYKSPLVMARLILNYFFYSPKEKESLKTMQIVQKQNLGYLQIQSTKPQSLAFGMGDSPIGLLGWFLEKYHDWIDTRNYQMSDDEILTAVMMHWIQGGTPGFRYYREAFHEKGSLAGLNAYKTYCPTPMGYSRFPKEVFLPPMDWLYPIANIQWTKEHEKGGHFPAVECPQLLVQDLQEWFGNGTVKTALYS